MAKELKRIKIDKIWYGWVGLARMSDGKRILIKWGALPGSIVDLRIVKQKKDYVEAHITHVVELDPKIVDGEIFCPHFFSLLSSNDANAEPRKVGCGGCKWQMLSYKNQLQLKEDIVNDAFTKIKKKLPELEVLSIIGSPEEKNYRNKIEFSFGKYITKGSYPTLNPSPLHGEGTQLPRVYTVGKNKLPSWNTMILLARELRQKQTVPELLLREILRNKQVNNLKFRRQHPIWNYIADFYCPEKSLVIELDGSIHNKPEQKKRDQERDAIMKQHSLNVIRFTNNDVFERVEEVIQTIIDISNQSPLATEWRGVGGEVTNLVLSNRSCGFHKQGEFSKIVDIHNCALISDEANEIFQYLKELCRSSGLPAYDQMTHQGFFRHIVIRQGTNTDQFLVNLAVADNNLKDIQIQQWDEFLELLKKDSFLNTKITSLVITYNNWLADIIRSQNCETKIFRGEGYIYEKLIFGNETEKAVHTDSKNNKTNKESLTEISFRVSPFSFFQTNTLWAQQLFGQAMKMVGNIEWTILDLYCGTWSIGISFLKTGKWDKLVWIEIVEEAITDAWHNAKINGLEDKVLFLANPAEKAFTQHPEIMEKLDNIGLVIIDPPRDGLHKNVVQTICDLKKQSDFKLLYISCNPVTMVRDIELLVAWGFGIKEIQPVDMFPQTHHIECIWVLT